MVSWSAFSACLRLVRSLKTANSLFPATVVPQIFMIRLEPSLQTTSASMLRVAEFLAAALANAACHFSLRLWR